MRIILIINTMINQLEKFKKDLEEVCKKKRENKYKKNKEEEKKSIQKKN